MVRSVQIQTPPPLLASLGLSTAFHPGRTESMAPAAAALHLLPLLSSRAAPTAATATWGARARSLRVAAQLDDTITSASTSTSDKPAAESFSAPPGFKPPEPKRFEVKPGQSDNIAGASFAIPLRLGTGVFVLGYYCLHFSSPCTPSILIQFNGIPNLHTGTPVVLFVSIPTHQLIGNWEPFCATQVYVQLRYSVSLVSPDEIPPDQYALDFQGRKVKETSKVEQCPRPEKPIEIYEFEGCPFCRKVREMVSVLDLDVLYYPCPKNGPTFRPKVLEMGGKKQFPYMVDPNTGVAMYESDDIIKYLAKNYGDGTVPIMLSLGLLTTITAGLAMSGRRGKGSSYTPSKLPPQPIEIWSYEGSPFCKIVREALVELELPHLLHSCARGSPKRQEFFKKYGLFQAPYIEDPNTGVKMFESAEIIEYLRATYAA